MTGVAPQVAEADQAVRETPDPAPPKALEISLATTEREARAAVQVLSEIWPQPDGRHPLSPELAWALAHAGNYVALVRVDGQPVGASLAFYGADQDGLLLHSHMTGLLPEFRGSSIGFAVKQHQRQWAVERAVDRVVWTFDPLVSRNAYFNVMKLGAVISQYYSDFYGPLTDGINAGDESDRCLVVWHLHDRRAVDAAAGAMPPVDLDALRSAGAAVVLDEAAGGAPRRYDVTAPMLLCRAPADVVTMRRKAPALAAEWRRAVRAVLVETLGSGYQVTGVSRDGWYVLSG